MKKYVVKYFDKERSRYLEEDEQSLKEDLWILSKIRTHLGHRSFALLELGCGGAGFLRLASLTFNDSAFIGADITKSLLLLARKKAKTTLLCSDAETLPFKTASFDVIVMRNLLHHIIGKSWLASRKCMWHVLLEVKRVLNKTGYLVVVEQGINSKFLSFFIFTLSFLFTEFNILVPKLTRGVIVNFLTPKDFIDMLEKLDVRILEMQNQHGWSIYKCMIRIFVTAQLRSGIRDRRISSN